MENLAKLRAPFAENQISKLPKPTKRQTDDVKADFKKGIRCTICGAWHHPDVVHLDYVGHAALTDRLLDTDIAWSWEPVALDDHGLPAFDHGGGLWIKLTVCGVTRFGYGSADGKEGGDAVKEIIGDALRNAAMRFGAALDLWHKGDLHIEEPTKPIQEERDAPFPKGPAKNKTELKALGKDFWRDVEACGDLDELDILLDNNQALMSQLIAGLPLWWNGGERAGMPYDGLSAVIDRTRESLMDQANAGWQSNPLNAG